MGKILLIVLTLISSMVAGAPVYTVVNSSFSETSPVSRKSDQWIDVTWQGTYNSSELVRVFIEHVKDNGERVDPQELLNKNFSSYFLSLPTNADGSRRLYFKLPTIYKSGKFKISVNVQLSAKFGILENLSDRTATITSQNSGQAGSSIELTYTLSHGTGVPLWSIIGPVEFASLNGNTVLLKSEGTITIRISFQEDSIYNSTFTEQTFTITPRTIPAITFEDISRKVSDGGFNLTATTDSPGTLTYSLVSSNPAGIIKVNSNGQVIVYNPGTATIKVTQEESGTFASTSKTATLTIEMTTGIIDPIKDREENAEYYTITGYKVEKPERGLFIRVTPTSRGKIYLSE